MIIYKRDGKEYKVKWLSMRNRKGEEIQRLAQMYRDEYYSRNPDYIDAIVTLDTNHIIIDRLGQNDGRIYDTVILNTDSVYRIMTG